MKYRSRRNSPRKSFKKRSLRKRSFKKRNLRKRSIRKRSLRSFERITKFRQQNVSISQNIMIPPGSGIAQKIFNEWMHLIYVDFNKIKVEPLLRRTQNLPDKDIQFVYNKLISVFNLIKVQDEQAIRLNKAIRMLCGLLYPSGKLTCDTSLNERTAKLLTMKKY